MDVTATPPAGAADNTAPATETVSATIAAADAGDFSKFQEAERAAKSGTPAEKVTRPVLAKGAQVPGKAGEPAKGPKPADVEADERLRSRVREAVETSTADLKRQLADATERIAKLTPAERKAEPVVAAPTLAADAKRIAALPNAPKAEDFDSTTEHAAALSAFITETRASERAALDRDVDTHLGRVKASIERVKTFHDRIEAFRKTDAGKDFGTKLTPEVSALYGWQRLQQVNAERAAKGEIALPATADHAIAEQIYDSEAPAEIALYLSEHPDEFTALRAAPNPTALLKAFTRLEDKVLAQRPAAVVEEPQTPKALREQADAVVDRHVTKAHEPAPKLGKAGSGVDPIKRALETGDVGMFLELDRQAMGEKRGLRH